MTTTTRTLFAIALVAAFAGPAASQGPNGTWASPKPGSTPPQPAAVFTESPSVQACRRHCDSLATGVHTVDTVSVRLARQESCSKQMVKE